MNEGEIEKLSQARTALRSEWQDYVNSQNRVNISFRAANSASFLFFHIEFAF